MCASQVNFLNLAQHRAGKELTDVLSQTQVLQTLRWSGISRQTTR